MKILVASDSFKESMTSLEVAETVEKAFLDIDKNHEVIKVPISDGGEGFVEALNYVTGGNKVFVNVKDSLGRDIEAFYGLSGDKETAFIEMATANGLGSIHPKQRNPLRTTTFGTGQLIFDALNKGVKKIVMGIGGSATNDGGAGMARALGVKFFDEFYNELDGSGGSLGRLYAIDDVNIDKRIKNVDFLVASDVDNPLTGKTGASRTYAKQKGADDQMIRELETNLRNYSRVLFAKYGKDISSFPGAGAAGGLGAGLMAFNHAKFNSGIEIVLEYNEIEEQLTGVDLVITGEGRIDSQTIFGKAPVGVSKKAKLKDIPCIAFCGITGEGYEAVYDHGINEVHPILDKIITIDKALKDGKQNLYNKALEVAKTYQK